MKQKTIVVIPAYNEEKTIGQVVQGVSNYCSKIVVVDDASSDDTSKLSQKNGAFVIKNSLNQGYSKSLDIGFRKAIELGADIVVTFDADAQHNPSDIPKMCAPLLNDEADLVVGIRSFKQRLMEHFLAFYSQRKIGISDPLSGVKAYKKIVYNTVGYFDNLGSIGMQLLFNAHKHNFRLKELPINFYKRNNDKSRFGQSLTGNHKIFKAFMKLIFFMREK